MLRLAADENFNNDIVWGVLRRNPAIDVVRIQDFEVRRTVPVAVAIEEIVLLAECGLEGEWEGQVRYLPLR